MAKTSLFIGDLSIFCKESDIHDMFAEFGEILEIKIMRNEQTSQNLSYGFLKYSNPLSAKRAMTELNHVVLCGRPMRINWASYRKKNNSRDPKESELSTSPIHVSFISYQVVYLVTEASLRELFSEYGEVIDVTLKKSNVEEDIPRQSGYGFVHYSIDQAGIRASMRAVEALNDVTVNDVNYKSSLSHTLNRLLTASSNTFEESGGDLSAEDSYIDTLPPYGSVAHYNGVYYQKESVEDGSQTAATANMMVRDNSSPNSLAIQVQDNYQGPVSYSYPDSANSSNYGSPITSYRTVFANNVDLISNGMQGVPVFASAPASPHNSYMGSPLQVGEFSFNSYQDYSYKPQYPHWGHPSPVAMTTREIIVDGICNMLTPTTTYYPSPVMSSRHPLSYPQGMHAGAQVAYGGPSFNHSGPHNFPLQANNSRFTNSDSLVKAPFNNPSSQLGVSGASRFKSSRSIINSLRNKQVAEVKSTKDAPL